MSAELGEASTKESDGVPLATRLRFPDGTATFLASGERVSDGLAKRLAEAVEAAEPVVFLHAFPLDSRMWEPSFEPVVSSGRLAVAVDFPGFGGSPLPPDAEEASMSYAAERVLVTLDCLGIGRAALVGCSMGGYVAFRVLAASPERVAGLLLVDTRAAADTEEGRAARAAAVEAIESGGRSRFLGDMAERLVAPGRLSSDPELAARLRNITGDQSDRALVAALKGLASRPDSTPLLNQIRVPTMVVAGELDRILPVEEAKKFASQIPDAEFVVVPGAGHLPNLESPEEFAEILRRFISSLRGERGKAG